MQSLASLMSLKQSDIGNLDDFNDSDEEGGEDRRTGIGAGQVAAFAGNDRKRISVYHISHMHKQLP